MVDAGFHQTECLVIDWLVELTPHSCRDGAAAGSRARQRMAQLCMGATLGCVGAHCEAVFAAALLARRVFGYFFAAGVLLSSRGAASPPRASRPRWRARAGACLGPLTAKVCAAKPGPCPPLCFSSALACGARLVGARGRPLGRELLCCVVTCTWSFVRYVCVLRSSGPRGDIR